MKLKTKLFNKGILSVLFFSPLLIFASGNPIQTPPKSDEFYQTAVKFLQGEGVIEDWFTASFLPLFDTLMVSEYGSMIVLGQAIAGAGMILYLSYIGWGMASGDRKWEIMPLIRPFATGLVLLNWLAFTNIIKKPATLMREAAITGFQQEQDQVNAFFL